MKYEEIKPATITMYSASVAKEEEEEEERTESCACACFDERYGDIFPAFKPAGEHPIQ